MKKIYYILSIACFLSVTVEAQPAVTANANEEAVKNYDGTGGHFEYALNDRERINVNYALTPRYPATIAHFMIHTPDPMPFSAVIVDATGKTVYRWKPEQKVYLYHADWNISGLKSGSYTVKVFLENEPKSVFEFRFSKK